MVHLIFSGSSKGTHTASNEIFKYVIIPPAYEVYLVYSFRRCNHHMCMCLCLFVVLAHLSQRLICEIGYSGPLSSVPPSVRQHFQMASSLKPLDRFKPNFIHVYSPYGIGERKFIR